MNAEPLLSPGKKPSPSAVKKTISLPADLARSAEEKAKAEQRSLSSYLRALIARDVRKAA